MPDKVTKKLTQKEIDAFKEVTRALAQGGTLMLMSMSPDGREETDPVAYLGIQNKDDPDKVIVYARILTAEERKNMERK